MAINIPGYLIHCGFATLFIFTALLLTWLLSKIINQPSLYEGYKKGFFVFWGFSLLGLTIGLLSGSSLSPVIGTVIPSTLTFFGLIVIYQFSTERHTDENKNIIAICILLNCVFMLYGNEMSSKFRMPFEENKRKAEHDFSKDIETHKNNLQIELKKHEFRLDSIMKTIEHNLGKDKEQKPSKGKE